MTLSELPATGNDKQNSFSLFFFSSPFPLPIEVQTERYMRTARSTAANLHGG